MHAVCSQESGNMIFILECSQFISFLFSFSLRTTHPIYKRKSFSHFLCLHLSFFIFLFYSVFIAFPTVCSVCSVEGQLQDECMLPSIFNALQGKKNNNRGNIYFLSFPKYASCYIHIHVKRLLYSVESKHQVICFLLLRKHFFPLNFFLFINLF